MRRMDFITNAPGPYNTASEQMAAEQRQPPAPVDADMGEELNRRAQYAASEAAWHEDAASRHRSVERACHAALHALSNNDPVPSPYSPPR